MKYLLIFVLWTGYCALHSFLISISFTNLMSRLLKKLYSFYRLFYVLISILLLVLLINYTERSDQTVIINYNYDLTILRQALTFGAVFIFFWVFLFNYDPLTFFGIRQILNLVKAKKTIQSKEISKSGILGVIRHPMYSALIVFLWCRTYKISDIIVNTILTIYIIIGTRLEEQKLILKFGDSYTKYQQEVPMLIPFAKSKRKN
jgi:methanethiol S-methyltransferase